MDSKSDFSSYSVKHRCGHEYRHVVENGEDSVKKYWMFNYNCPDCKSKAENNNYTNQSKLSAKINKSSGLPDLEGTEKQIKLCEIIRVKACYEIDKIIDKINKSGHPNKDKLIDVFEMVKKENTCTEWINNRRRNWYIWFKEICIDMFGDELK